MNRRGAFQYWMKKKTTQANLAKIIFKTCSWRFGRSIEEFEKK
jgi:hypothetical protein